MSPLEADVRRVDEDRWLASCFAAADVSVRLVAIYAVNHEIARVSEAVREPELGRIRLQWWREALTDVHAGRRPPAHPVLEAYATAMAGVAMPHAAWDSIIGARDSCDFLAEPFGDWADVEAYAEQTAGNVIRIALAACGAYHPENGLAGYAGRAWAYVGLMRSEAAWRSRGRSFLPRAHGSIDALRSRAALAHSGARSWAKTMAQAGFPAFGYIALVPGYLRALDRGHRDRPLLLRQLKLVAAAATGSV